MRRLGNGLRFAASLLLLAGCHSESYIPPKPGPEELRVPPLEESRFSKPVEYPKGTLNQDAPPKYNDPAALKNSGAGGGRMGGGPGF